MTTYQTRLKSREEIAEGTMAFHLEKPAGFQFQSGQYPDITLINPPETDSPGVVRTFSIASAPYENELLVATRMRNSAFKHVLATIPLRTELKLDGPMPRKACGLLGRGNRNYTFSMMSEMEKSKLEWQGERGFINREMLMRHICDLHGPIYYIAGPPAMVAAMRQMLTNAGAEEDDIRTEEFAGY